MTWLRCRAENSPGRRFCGECGGPLAVLCGACGFSNEPTIKFCGGCGAPLGATPATATAKFASPERPIAQALLHAFRQGLRERGWRGRGRPIVAPREGQRACSARCRATLHRQAQAEARAARDRELRRLLVELQVNAEAALRVLDGGRSS